MSYLPDSQDLPDDYELVVIPSTSFEAWAEDFTLAAVALRERASRLEDGEAEVTLAEQFEEAARLAEQREVAAAAGIDVSF